MAGVIAGFVFLPFLINELRIKLSFGLTKANALRRKEEKREEKETRNSKVYKDRLFHILEKIKEETTKGNRHIEITSLSQCKTDQQIKKYLEERKFEVSSWRSSNSLIISW